MEGWGGAEREGRGGKRRGGEGRGGEGRGGEGMGEERMGEERRGEEGRGEERRGEERRGGEGRGGEGRGREGREARGVEWSGGEGRGGEGRGGEGRGEKGRGGEGRGGGGEGRVEGRGGEGRGGEGRGGEGSGGEGRGGEGSEGKGVSQLPNNTVHFNAFRDCVDYPNRAMWYNNYYNESRCSFLLFEFYGSDVLMFSVKLFSVYCLSDMCVFEACEHALNVGYFLSLLLSGFRLFHHCRISLVWSRMLTSVSPSFFISLLAVSTYRNVGLRLCLTPSTSNGLQANDCFVKSVPNPSTMKTPLRNYIPSIVL